MSKYYGNNGFNLPHKKVKSCNKKKRKKKPTVNLFADFQKCTQNLWAKSANVYGRRLKDKNLDEEVETCHDYSMNIRRVCRLKKRRETWFISKDKVILHLSAVFLPWMFQSGLLRLTVVAVEAETLSSLHPCFD